MKGFKPTDWPRAIVTPISTMFNQAVSGFGGKTRRKVQLLKEALANADAECDRLRQEMHELVQYTDAELQQMKQERDRAIRERDDLQLKVLLLEEELEAMSDTSGTSSQSMPFSSTETVTSQSASGLTSPTVSAIAQRHSDGSITQLAPDSAERLAIEASLAEETLSSASSAHSLLPDLSEFRLALVGGHPSTRRGVIKELQLHYGLKHCVEIPRMSEANTSRNRVKSKIYRCNLVVLITGYMSHRLTEIVFSLKDAGMLAGDVLQVNCKGKTGVLRGILEHVESRTT